MLPFYTKWLSIEEYGITDTITIYSMFILGIVSAGITEAIFIFPKDRSREVQKAYFSTGLAYIISSLISGFFLFLGVQQILLILNVEGIFVKYNHWIFLIVLSMFLQSYMQQFSRSIDKTKVYAIMGIIHATVTAILSFILIPKYQLEGFLLSQFFAFLSSAGYSFIHTRSYQYFNIYYVGQKRLLEMLRYSIPLVPNGIMWLFISSLNRPMLEYYLGVKEIGLFAVANKFPSILITVFSVFIFSWQTSVLEEFKKSGYSDFYNKVLRLIFLVLTLIACLLTIFSKVIIRIIADDKFIDAWYILPILFLSVIFSSISAFVGTNFLATRKSKYYFYSSIWGAGSSIVLNLILIPLFGISGAAIAVVLSYGVMALSRIKYTWNVVKIDNIKVYISMLVLHLLFVLITLFMDNIVIKNVLYVSLFMAILVLNGSVLSTLKKYIINTYNKK